MIKCENCEDKDKCEAQIMHEKCSNERIKPMPLPCETIESEEYKAHLDRWMKGEI